MKIVLAYISFAFLVLLTHQYPIRCDQIGDSVLGTITDCDVSHDPLPFKWSATFKLKKNIKWAGVDDVYSIYSNPDDGISGDCTTYVPLPGNYSKNDNITIQQMCLSFTPPLQKGANLVVLMFYSHHDSFDDVLMINVPIPGYVNQDQNNLKQNIRQLSIQEKGQIIKKIQEGKIKLNIVKE